MEVPSIHTEDHCPSPLCTKMPVPLWQPFSAAASLKPRTVVRRTLPEAFRNAIPNRSGEQAEMPELLPSTISPSIETSVVLETTIATASGEASNRLEALVTMAEGITIAPFSASMSSDFVIETCSTYVAAQMWIESPGDAASTADWIVVYVAVGQTCSCLAEVVKANRVAASPSTNIRSFMRIPLRVETPTASLDQGKENGGKPNIAGVFV